MAGQYHRWPGWFDSCYTGEMVKMNPMQLVLFLLAIINLIAISLFIYFKKSSWAIGLSILEIIIVYLSAQTG